MPKYIIDRNAASEFDAPEWLNDLWFTAIKKFGGEPIAEVCEACAEGEKDAKTIKVKYLEVEDNLRPFCDYLATLTHRTSDEWVKVIWYAIAGEHGDA